MAMPSAWAETRNDSWPACKTTLPNVVVHRGSFAWEPPIGICDEEDEAVLVGGPEDDDAVLVGGPEDDDGSDGSKNRSGVLLTSAATCEPA